MSNKSRSACSAEEFEKKELRKNSMTSWWTRAVIAVGLVAGAVTLLSPNAHAEGMVGCDQIILSVPVELVKAGKIGTLDADLYQKDRNHALTVCQMARASFWVYEPIGDVFSKYQRATKTRTPVESMTDGWRVADVAVIKTVYALDRGLINEGGKK